MEGAAAGCEKLKPIGPDLAPADIEKPEVVVVLLLLMVLLVWDPVPPNGELDIDVV